MKRLSHSIIEWAKHIFFTPHCIGCGVLGAAQEPQTERFLCARCEALPPRAHILSCPMCNRRVVTGPRGGATAHGSCQKEKPYLLAYATSYHNPVIQAAIKTFKYKSVRPLALPLGRIVAECVQFLRFPNIQQYIVIPMPLHPKKERVRGFNQSREIGIVAARLLNLACVEDAIIRIRNTKPQVKMKNPDARNKNIAGAFFVTKPEMVARKNILLIDDIYTSGATLTEAARVLKGAGAKKIIALVVAKA